jgi:phage gpG-like protein
MDSRNLDPFLNNMATAIKAATPRIVHEMGSEAVTYSKENFRRQAFDGKPWPKRKKDRTPGRAVLIKTGHLRNSIHITNQSAGSVSIGTDLPYAQIHNDGGVIQHRGREVVLNFRRKGGKLLLSKVQTESQQRLITDIRRGNTGDYTTSMPQRQFLGMTTELRDKIIANIRQEITSTFRIVR